MQPWLAVMLMGAVLAAKPPQKAARPTPSLSAVKAGPKTVVVLVDAAGLSVTAQQALFENLKKEVHKSVSFTWQDPPPISVDELVLALSCKRMDVDCLVKMGDVLKADAVMVASVASKGREVQLLLVQFRPERAIQKTGVAFKGEDGLAASVAASARGLLGATRPAVLEVESQPVGAQVLLDGTLLGPAPVSAPAQAEGAHDLEARLAGHQVARQKVTLHAGETTHVLVALTPNAVEPVAAPPPEPAPAVQAPASEPVASGPAFWVAPVRYLLLGSGIVVGALGALVMAGGLAPVMAYGAAWLAATALSIQRGISLGHTLFIPSIAGGVGAGAGLLLLPVALGLLGGGLLLGLILG